MAGKSGSGSGKPRSSSNHAHHTKQTVKGSNFYRDDAKKIKHLKMLTNGHKATRDRDGKIIQEAQYQSKEVTPGRIQPDRRWFGNTRVISQEALTHFRESLAAKQADPFSVILKQNKLPMSLLQESTKISRPDLATAEPFADTFGPKSQRKRPRIDVGNFEELAKIGGAKWKRPRAPGAELLEGEVASDEEDQADHDLGADEMNAAQKGEAAEAELSNAPLDYILQAGTSRRIWGELYKVIDSSDIILHVLDARDPLGTRCHSVENYLAKEKKSKKVIYILNKVDLIPGWAAVGSYRTQMATYHKYPMNCQVASKSNSAIIGTNSLMPGKRTRQSAVEKGGRLKVLLRKASMSSCFSVAKRPLRPWEIKIG